MLIFVRFRLRYARVVFHEPCDVSAPKVMNTENAALSTIHESPTKYGYSLRGVVVTISASQKSIIRMNGTLHAKKVGEPEYLFKKVTYIHHVSTATLHACGT